MLTNFLDKFLTNKPTQPTIEEDLILELTPQGLKDIETNSIIQTSQDYERRIDASIATLDYLIAVKHGLPRWVTGEFPDLTH
jgi:hypothetical protein